MDLYLLRFPGSVIVIAYKYNFLPKYFTQIPSSTAKFFLQLSSFVSSLLRDYPTVVTLAVTEM